jgi:hypothetical protein
MLAANRTYILGDETGVLHRKCTLFVPNKIAISTLAPRERLENLSTYPRFEGGEGGNASSPQNLGPELPALGLPRA